MGDVPEPVLRGSADWLGYGHVDASLWFVGLEDRLSIARCTRVDDRRQYFDLCRGFDRFEDFVEVWENVFGRRVRDGEGGLSTRWWASAFTLAYQGTDLTALSTPDREQRIRDYTYGDPRIGRADGDTALTNVYPLPKPVPESINPYDHVWDDIEDYRADIHGDRLDLFVDAIRESDGLDCIVSHAPSEDFTDPIVDRFDGNHDGTWPALRDGDTFDAYWLHGDADNVVLIDAPTFHEGHVTYETLQFVADRVRTARETPEASV